MPEPVLPQTEAHDEAEELLPWYATGQLDQIDRVRVERHLSNCAGCRQQLAVERRLIDEFQTLSPEVESGWARLRAQIEPAPKRARFSDMLGEIWGILTRPAVAILAATQVAFIAVAGTLIALSQPAYEALGSAPVPAAANMIVMFRSDATETEMRQALEAVDASLVGGPTSTAAYLLHVPPERRQAALDSLQSDAAITMAQPIDGVAQ